jgi:hypothetical protein
MFRKLFYIDDFILDRVECLAHFSSNDSLNLKKTLEDGLLLDCIELFFLVKKLAIIIGLGWCVACGRARGTGLKA